MLGELINLVAEKTTIIATLLGVAGVVTVARRWSRKFNDMFTLVVCFPILMVTIAFDVYLPSLNFLLKMPRNRSEIIKNPKQFFDLLRTNDMPVFQMRTLNSVEGGSAPVVRHIPANAEFVDLEVLAGITSEPLKNAQLGIFNVKYKEASGKLVEKKLFTKFTSERQVVVYVKALFSCFQPVPNEVAFYRHVAPTLKKHGIRVPNCYATFHSTAFNRMCVCMELVPEPWATVPDWKGASSGQVKALVRAQAALHGTHWCPAENHPNLSFCRSRKGLSWIEAIKMLYSKDETKTPKWVPRLFDAFEKHFANAFMSLSHADCRPGNMLYAKTAVVGDTAAKAKAGDDDWEVIMTDWEALSITPFLWDLTYLTTIGQSVDERRNRFDDQIKTYIDSLFAWNADAKRQLLEVHGDKLMENLTNESALLVVCIWFFGAILAAIGGVGEVQGNTEDDCNAWSYRLGTAIVDLIDPEKFGAILKAGDAQVVKDLKSLVENAEGMVKASSEPTISGSDDKKNV